MTRSLVSDDNADGFRPEHILHAICNDILHCGLDIAEDTRPGAQHVMFNNRKILNNLSEAIIPAEYSTRTFDKAFGPTASKPRIGKE
ncbi:MAG: hypothetical protein P8L66_11615 [Rhodospirillaceae bacterium]|nr:hypothetical protein [Rhodospirillaceae bacterium]